MERLSAPERTREELRALMDGELGTAAGAVDLVRLALRLIVEEALEGEVADALGRERYERGEGAAPAIATAIGRARSRRRRARWNISAPQVRDTPEPFVSAVRAALSGRTEALEELAVELYARGLSTRDIEDAFTDEDGRRLLSRAAVSEITERLWAEYEEFSQARSVRARRSSTCSSTASPSGCGRASRARRCWPPGASARTGARCCWR